MNKTNAARILDRASVDYELRAYPIHDDGTVGDHEVLHNFYPHRAIDGMRLDVDGNIVATAGWTQSGPGPMIYVFAPNGRVLGTHPIPEGIPIVWATWDRKVQFEFSNCRGLRPGYLYPQYLQSGRQLAGQAVH